MATSPMELSDGHKAQLERFVSFFKGKRDRLLQDRHAELAEFKSDRLPDESQIFNYAEANFILDTYYTQAMMAVSQEFEKMVNTSAVYVSQLMCQAEQMGLSVAMDDISIVEDQARIDQISSVAGTKHGPLPPAKKGQLSSLGVGGSDPNTIQEINDLKEEKRQMTDRYQLMQSEMSNVLKERSALAEELEKVKNNFKQLRSRMQETGTESSSSANLAELERALNETKSILDARSHECEAARADLNRRLGDSTQFRDIKAIVKKKTQEIKELRQYIVDAGLAPPSYATEGLDLEAEDD